MLCAGAVNVTIQSIPKSNSSFAYPACEGIQPNLKSLPWILTLCNSSHYNPDLTLISSALFVQCLGLSYDFRKRLFLLRGW